MMMDFAEETGAYRSHFDRFEESLGSEVDCWPHALRKDSLECFVEQGFPKTHMEEWRFTSVAPLVSTPFELAAPTPRDLTPTEVDRFTLGDWKRSRIVFANGRFYPELSSFRALPDGVIIGSLAEALTKHRDLVEPHLGRYVDSEKNAFAALNSAFVADGAFVYLPRNCVIDDAIHLLFYSRINGSATVSHPRNLIIAEAGSQVKIVESYVGVEKQIYFTNAVTEVFAGENAVLDHYKLQRESHRAFHVATLQFHQERNASLSTHSISLGGGLVRNDINTVLGGEGGECTLNGIYAVGMGQHVDHHTSIDHAKPHCSSRELYKGILDEDAQAVFNGRIIVRPDAQKTDSQQSNKNLLLSDEALVNTNPQLEIYADDVKCAHGATIGQLDADALFYLRSRGIDEEAARSLLVHGFLSDVSSRFQIGAVRSAVECILMTDLPQGSMF
jgi:Fe-S cluster assembly protein SufD